MADGTVYIREGGTIPWRTQNPCNVRPNGRKESQYLQPLRLAVAVTVSGKFGMYGCEVDGWETEKNYCEATCIVIVQLVKWQKYIVLKKMAMTL